MKSILKDSLSSHLNGGRVWGMVKNMNINEIAKHAGVSTATVSRVINGSNKVSQKTADKVLSIVRTLGYHPSSHARALASGKSHLIGLIISDIVNPFFPELVKCFEEIAVKNGLEVIVANTGYDPERMAFSVKRMIQRKAEGVAVMTSEMDQELLAQLETRNIPVVFLDTGKVGLHASNIEVDYGKGISEAVEYLVHLGHKRIGYIGGPHEYSSSRTRRSAFLRCLKKFDLLRQDDFIQTGNFKTDGGKAAIRRLLRIKKRPTAVLTANDLSAIGALHAAIHEGLSVPGDISIIGFDDIDFCQLTQPPLTTIRLSRKDLAEKAFNALLSGVSGESYRGRKYRVETSLIIRGSTGRCSEK
jgi:DNA-binding LacI/PurR family transcriptional regulator